MRLRTPYPLLVAACLAWLAMPGSTEAVEANATCSRSSDCSSIQFCHQGQCVDKLAIGHPCTGVVVCATGSCQAGICTCAEDADCPGAAGGCRMDSPANFCAECAHSAHCKSTETCVEGACTPKARIGAPCTHQGMCITNSCIHGFCGCASDDHCRDGRCDASSGRCMECTSSSECKSSEFCGGGTCKSKGKLGAPCKSSIACASNRCAGGICR